MMGLDDVLREARAWQSIQFPEATPESCARHLRREARELVERPLEPHEWADALMLVFCGAELAGVDLAEAVAEKLAINKARKWGEPNDEGFREHVR